MGRKRKLCGSLTYSPIACQRVWSLDKAHFAESGIVIDETDSSLRLLTDDDRIIRVKRGYVTSFDPWERCKFSLSPSRPEVGTLGELESDSLTCGILEKGLKRKSKRLGFEGIDKLDITWIHKVELEDLRQDWCR